MSLLAEPFHDDANDDEQEGEDESDGKADEDNSPEC